jgi:hypothetical protein
MRLISMGKRGPMAAAKERGGRECGMAARLGAGPRSAAAIWRPCRGKGDAAPEKRGGKTVRPAPVGSGSQPGPRSRG